MKPHTTTTYHAELMSALVDGQLPLTDCAELLSALEQDELLMKKWSAYHFIGDALRSSESVDERVDMVFVERLQQRLSREAVSAPANKAFDEQSAVKLVPLLGVGGTRLPHRRQAANDGSFRWKAVAGLASLAAVGAIAWNVFASASGAGSPQLALDRDRGSEQFVVASPQGPMVRDVRLEEFLAAHRQLGSTSAAQMPSAFLRNAGFDAPHGDGAR